MVEAGYLLASFPDLAFDIESTVVEYFDVNEFLASSEVILPEHNAHDLRLAIENPLESQLKIAHQWHCFVESVQHETARLRWNKTKSGSFPQAKGAAVSAEAQTLAAHLPQTEHPLDAQLCIFQTLWDRLEALDAQYQSSMENIAIYTWKLQILSNLVHFKKEQGKKTWRELVHTITKKAGFSPTAISGGIEHEH